jgi:hypothetical protein
MLPYEILHNFAAHPLLPTVHRNEKRKSLCGWRGARATEKSRGVEGRAVEATDRIIRYRIGLPTRYSMLATRYSLLAARWNAFPQTAGPVVHALPRNLQHDCRCDGKKSRSRGSRSRCTSTASLWLRTRRTSPVRGRYREPEDRTAHGCVLRALP